MDWIAGWLTGMQDWAAARDVLRLDLLGKLILATILGGVIGWEREASGKAAGLRSALVPSSKPPAPPCWSSASCGRSRGSRNASRRRAGGGPCASCSPQAQAR